MRTSLRLTSLIAAVGLFAASCGSNPVGNPPTTGAPPGDSPPGDSPPAVSLDGTSWMVTSVTLDGVTTRPLAGRPATLSVDGGRATGSTGCNTFHAAVSITGSGGLSFGDFAVTEIGCDPLVMEYEAAMLAALRAATGFAWDADRLTLTGKDGAAIVDLVAAVPAPDVGLDAATWWLTGITANGASASVVSGTSPYLVFDLSAGAVRGNGGCNDFGASVVLDAGRLTISDLIHTEIACTPDVMRQEADFLRILLGATTWQVEGAGLTIASSDGEVLTFVAGTGPRPEEAALAWIGAVASGDLDQAAALMAPSSLAYADAAGGLDALATELAEGWGGWVQVEDRRAWSVTGRFSDDTPTTAVVLMGTVQQEGMTEHRAVSLLMLADGDGYLVDPFAAPAPVGFVVPRDGFADRVAPDVPFEFGIPAGSEVLAYLDGSGPLALDVEPSAGGVWVTALVDPLPQPGEHALTVLHRTAGGAVGVRTVHFVTHP